MSRFLNLAGLRPRQTYQMGDCPVEGGKIRVSLGGIAGRKPAETIIQYIYRTRWVSKIDMGEKVQIARLLE